MAAVLLSAGAKGKRCSLANGEVMIHQPLGGMQGQAKDMEIAANHIIRMKNRLNNILAQNCGKSLDEIAALCDRDYYMDAQEAVDLGIVDTII